MYYTRLFSCYKTKIEKGCSCFLFVYTHIGIYCTSIYKINKTLSYSVRMSGVYNLGVV